MKHTNPITKITFFILMLTFGIFHSCTESDSDSSDDPLNEINSEVDANKVTQSLKFKDITIKTGSLSPVNTVVDLKIWDDSLLWVKGIQKRIRIKKPSGVTLGTFSAQVKGSDFYVEGPLQKEEESDSIAVLSFDFDETGWKLPITFGLTMQFKDEGGTPLDQFDIPVVIEDAEGGNCNFDPSKQQVWEWIYTTMGGVFENAPGFLEATNGTVSGCCDADGNSYYGDCLYTLSYREVHYQNVFAVNSEYIKFFPDGTLAGELHQFTQNVRPSESDFCGGNAGYTKSHTYNVFTGTYTFKASSCSITIEMLEGQTAPIYASNGIKLGDLPLPIYVGAGPMVQYKILSPHFIKEIRGVEGASLERLYEAKSGLGWHD